MKIIVSFLLLNTLFINAYAEKPYLAFIGVGVDGSMREKTAMTFMDSLFNRLRNIDSFEVISYERYNHTLKANRFNIKDSINRSRDIDKNYWLINSAKMLKIDKAVFLAFSQKGKKSDSINVQANLLNIDKGVYELCYAAKATNNTLTNLIDTIAYELEVNLKPHEKDSTKQELPILKRYPQQIYAAMPDVPDAMLYHRPDETVFVLLLIDENGLVTKAEIHKGSNIPGFDNAALEAAKKSRFKPAMDCNDKPMKAWVMFPVKYRTR